MGDSEAIGSNVPNFVKVVPYFVKDVPSVPKCVPRGGLTPNHFLMGSKMKSWIIHVQMGDLKTIESDVPNLIKDVPNFVKDVPYFVKDVPSIPMCVPRWGSVPKSLPYGF